MSSNQTAGDHYSKMTIEPVDYIEGNKLGYSEGNVVKYISRHKDKNGLEDIQKCVDYCCMIAEKQYGSIIETPLVSSVEVTEEAIDAYQKLYNVVLSLVKRSFPDSETQQGVMFNINSLVSDYVQAELRIPR